MHREGVQAELSGRFNRADAYWYEVRQSLNAIPKEAPAWSDLAAQLKEAVGETILSNPDELRTRFINEVLVDTHCAFYNGRIRADLPPTDRAYDHVTHLFELLQVTGASLDSKIVLIGEPARAQIQEYQRRGDWGKAQVLARELVGRFPNHLPHQDIVAEILFLEVLAKIKPNSTGHAALAEAAILLSLIQALERFCGSFPYAIGSYEFLANAHYIRAIKLASAGRSSQALTEIELALAYRPHWQEASTVRHEIELQLNRLQSEVNVIRSRVGVRYVGGRMMHTSLNADGLALCAEADAGFKPREQVRQSRMQSIASAMRLAQARQLWFRLDLRAPSADWDARALELLAATELLQRKNPTDAPSLETALKDSKKARPELNWDRICSDGIMEALLRPAAPATLDGSAPHLSTPTTPTQSFDYGPFDLWLFSSRELGLKALAVAAAIVLVIGLAGWIIDRQRQEERNEAFARLQGATKQLDADAAKQAVDDFLANPPWFRSDGRTLTVVGVSKQFAEWRNRHLRDAAFQKLVESVRAKDESEVKKASDNFLAAHSDDAKDPRKPEVIKAAKDAEFWPSQRQRDAAFGQLQRAVQAMDDADAIKAAEAFFAATPAGDADVRTKQVQKAYRESFARWFSQQPDEADTREGLRRFQALNAILTD